MHSTWAKRVSGLVERIDMMATRLPQPTTSSADYIQDVESEDARDNPLEKKELVRKGNDIDATTRGEHNFNALDFPTIHATVEQSIVKYFLNLSLSQDGFLIFLVIKKTCVMMPMLFRYHII
jgi:hypothetical protein